jgi:hypothetical protein
VNEVSVILKNNILIDSVEFGILDRCATYGRFWILTHRHTADHQYVMRYKAVEYIFDPEALTIFRIASQNILATWDTAVTRHYRPGDVLQILDSTYISPVPGL